AGSEETNEAARAAGVGLNYWGVPAETVASEPSGPTSWAGRCPKDLSAAAKLLESLALAGAGWVIWGWPPSVSFVVEAAGIAGVDLAC
ncbi:MAG: hypothetical protein ACRDZ5_07880, partial [Acidimicrobiales bacterium]